MYANGAALCCRLEGERQAARRWAALGLCSSRVVSLCWGKGSLGFSIQMPFALGETAHLELFLPLDKDVSGLGL